MDPQRKFTLKEIVGIGVISGITVSLIKLIQWNFHLDEVSLTQIGAALITTVGYLALGGIGAMVLVDHEATGQKMLKGAFLAGFMAPSFFLAALNNPAAIRPDFQRNIERVPKISDLFIGSAFAADEKPLVGEKESRTGLKGDGHTGLKDPKGVFLLLEKKQLDPGLGIAVRNALGWAAIPTTYTYVVGTTEDQNKAASTAQTINRIFQVQQFKENAYVIQPQGTGDFYVAVGKIGSLERAAEVADISRAAGFSILPKTDSEDGKKAAGLLIGGRVIDARAMFSKDRD